MQTTSFEIDEFVLGSGAPGQNACLPGPLPDDGAGCRVLTATQTSGCDCSKSGLAPTTADITSAVRAEMVSAGQCGPGSMSGIDCSAYCVCEVSPAVGTSLVDCQTAPQPDANSSGWCYIFSAQGHAQATLLAGCEARPQALRFIGNTLPADGVSTFIACQSTTTALAAPAALGSNLRHERRIRPRLCRFQRPRSHGRRSRTAVLVDPLSCQSLPRPRELSLWTAVGRGRLPATRQQRARFCPRASTASRPTGKRCLDLQLPVRGQRARAVLHMSRLHAMRAPDR